MTCHKSGRRVPILEAADRLGIKNPQLLRVALQHDRYPFGTAVPMPGGQWAYYINERRLEMYLSGEDMVMAMEREVANRANRQDAIRAGDAGGSSRRQGPAGRPAAG